MDTGGMILTCMLLFQMACILIMLNPVYDVRKLTIYINRYIKHYRSYYCISIVSYFMCVVYFGMYIPLQHIHKLIFGGNVDRYEKIILLSKVEKNYIIAGFSLFLLVVLYGIRALISYTAGLMDISDAGKPELVLKTSSKDKKPLCSSVNILPNLLRVKRSISYETILFTNELREQLKNVLKNVDFPHNRSSTLSSILEINQAASD